MAISAANVTKLNKMNRVAKDALLGTAISDLQTAIVSSGSVTVSSAQASASAVAVAVSGATKGEIWQYSRSGSPITEKMKLVRSGSVRTISGSTAANCILTGDTLNYVVW